MEEYKKITIKIFVGWQENRSRVQPHFSRFNIAESLPENDIKVQSNTSEIESSNTSLKLPLTASGTVWTESMYPRETGVAHNTYCSKCSLKCFI